MDTSLYGSFKGVDKCTPVFTVTASHERASGPKTPCAASIHPSPPQNPGNHLCLHLSSVLPFPERRGAGICSTWRFQSGSFHLVVCFRGPLCLFCGFWLISFYPCMILFYLCTSSCTHLLKHICNIHCEVPKSGEVLFIDSCSSFVLFTVLRLVLWCHIRNSHGWLSRSFMGFFLYMMQGMD